VEQHSTKSQRLGKDALVKKDKAFRPEALCLSFFPSSQSSRVTKL
jgi:hypothetical protein